MADPVVTGLFRALVNRAGGVEVAAALLEARWGVGHKGTVSKMCAGHIGVTVEAAIALEDFLSVRSISDWMSRRVAAGADNALITDLAADSMLTAGAAHAAITRAIDHRGAGGTDLTVAEAADVIAQMTALQQLAEQIISKAQAVIPQFAASRGGA